MNHPTWNINHSLRLFLGLLVSIYHLLYSRQKKWHQHRHVWRECCDICEGYCVAKGDNTKVVSILHTLELYFYSLLFCVRLCKPDFVFLGDVLPYTIYLCVSIVIRWLCLALVCWKSHLHEGGLWRKCSSCIGRWNVFILLNNST